MTLYSRIQVSEKHCVFQSAGDWLGWPITELREITFRPAVMPVPFSDPALAGLCYFRSEFLPVLSLRALAEHGAAPSSAERQMLVLKTCDGVWGLLVDRVIGLESLETSPSTAVRNNDWNAATLGWANHRGRVVRVIDPEAFVQFVKRRLEQVWNRELPAACVAAVAAGPVEDGQGAPANCGEKV
jgi:chemotaxis signal transduction protein